MKISKDFEGGNIRVISIKDNVCHIEPELRDTVGPWFYWAFKVSGAAGKKIKFVFNDDYVGYYGAAISYDLKNWKWQYKTKQESQNSFTYTFSNDENEVYFAHSFVYTSMRLFDFINKNKINHNVLCLSKKGREIPFISFGNGENHIILTARHHACESTGSYVLEGVLEELNKKPIKNTKVFCVPMVDYDGVIDGDQGKNRHPYDHNRDYNKDEPAIYSSVSKIREYAKNNKVVLAFDFHSPWHCGGINDKVFLVKNNIKPEHIDRFGELLEELTKDTKLKYLQKDDMPANTRWNMDSTPSFDTYIASQKDCLISLSVETCYFGTEDNKFGIDEGIILGKCFAKAIKKLVNENL